MAKQNPATDPVSAAMSAIESALNLTDDDEAVLADVSAFPPQLVPAKPTAATPVLKPSQPASDTPTLLRAGPPQPSAPENEPKPAIPASTPANDDRENVGAVLQAMNARPASRTPFIIALAASLLWAAVCALYAYISVWSSASRRPLDMLLRPRDSALSVGGARANHLHVRLCRAIAATARVATIGARDLSGRRASGRARDDGRRARRDLVSSHPSRTHING